MNLMNSSNKFVFFITHFHKKKFFGFLWGKPMSLNTKITLILLKSVKTAQFIFNDAKTSKFKILMTNS